MSLGTEILFICVPVLIVLRPKQLHSLLGLVARAKAQFEEAKRGFRSQLVAEVVATHQEGKTDTSPEFGAVR